MPGDDKTVVTLREIAEAAGISVDGARRRAKRRDRDGIWRILPQNHPQDPLRIEMPRQDLDDIGRQGADTSDRQALDVETGRPEGDGSRRQAADTSDRQEADVRFLQDRIAELQVDLEREREERREERDRAGRLADQVIEAERAKAAIEKAEALASAEVAHLRGKIEAAMASHREEIEAGDAEIERRDAEIGDLRNALAEMRSRSWWRRLVG